MAYHHCRPFAFIDGLGSYQLTGMILNLGFDSIPTVFGGNREMPSAFMCFAEELKLE